MIFISNVAFNGSTVAQSTKSGHVSYREQVWNPEHTWINKTCSDSDGDPYDCSYWQEGYDYYDHKTDAKITGTVSSSSNVYVNGKPIAVQSSNVTEKWVADPAPSPQNGGTIISISPGTSGTGTGSVTFGNSKNVYANSKLVADTNSTVTTHLGTSPKITSGSPNVFIG